LGPGAEQHDSAGLGEERRCRRAWFAGRAVDVIAPEDDSGYLSGAQRRSASAL
jgi:hypothetical protein